MNRVSEAQTVDRVRRMSSAEDLIRPATETDVWAMRANLHRFVWGTRGFPAHVVPAGCRADASPSGLAALTGASHIDAFVVRMTDFEFESHCYLVHPVKSNGRVLLYHHGHTHDTEIETMRVFLDAGYALMVFWMPLLGPNPRSVVARSARFGHLLLGHHDDLALLDPSLDGSPIQLFVEPVVAGVNQLEVMSAYDVAGMVGLSGGGWTTTLAAAVDPRIPRTYPVAGTLPIWLRVGSGDWRSGDYEENLVALYDIANYLELYVLGASGPDRHQLQILNRYDSRCFAGVRHEFYVEAVRRRVDRIGAGRFSFWLDETHAGHAVSASATALIRADLATAFGD